MFREIPPPLDRNPQSREISGRCRVVSRRRFSLWRGFRLADLREAQDVAAAAERKDLRGARCSHAWQHTNAIERALVERRLLRIGLVLNVRELGGEREHMVRIEPGIGLLLVVRNCASAIQTWLTEPAPERLRPQLKHCVDGFGGTRLCFRARHLSPRKLG
jgi:hypothetical protein